MKLYPKKVAAGNMPRSLLNYGLRGNVSSYFLGTEAIIDLFEEGFLPPKPEILAATIGITFVGPKRIPMKHFTPFLKICQPIVAQALKFFISTNPIYAGYQISERNLRLLPVDGIPDELCANINWNSNVDNLADKHQTLIPDEDPEDDRQDDGEDDDAELEGD